MTVKEFISDILLQLNQGDISDDSTLEWSQIKAWLTYHANGLIATEINSKLDHSEMVPSQYLTREECLVSELEDTDCGDDCQDRISITLQNDVLTLNNDGGIVMVQTDEGTQVLKAGSINQLVLFNQMRFAKSSAANLVYYRQGSKTLYIDGMSSVDIPFDKFHVWYVAKQDYSTASDSTVINVSDLILPLLMDSVLQRGKLELYGSESDKSSDGVDYHSPAYHLAIQNPENNDQQQQ